MGDLSEVELDARRAAEVLAALAARLSAGGIDADSFDRSAIRALAEEGALSAARVCECLRMLRGPGDGAVAAYPPRLGPWRNWCPPRGHIFGAPRADDRQWRGDPGE